MLYWGVLTLAFAFVKNLSTVIGLRLYGVAEAGFFPDHDYESLFLSFC
jgi:hypothetical protein